MFPGLEGSLLGSVSLITLPLTSDSGEETGDRYRHLTAAPLRHRGYIWSLHLLKRKQSLTGFLVEISRL